MISKLPELQAGDYVIYHSGRQNESAHKVARVTTTQIVLEIQYALLVTVRFNRVTGREIGNTDKWFPSYIKAASPEELEALRRKNKHARLVSHLSRLSWDALPLETLEAVKALLP